MGSVQVQMQLSKFVKFMVLSSSFCSFSISKSVRLFEEQGGCLIWFSFIDIKALQAEVKKYGYYYAGKEKWGKLKRWKKNIYFSEAALEREQLPPRALLQNKIPF